ncbi:MAG: serine hydrolase domain-containing protein [Longimicrobiales bacterium]
MNTSHALPSTLVLAFALALPSAAVAQASTAPTFPGAEWEYVSRQDLAAYGWDSNRVQSAFAFLRDSSNATGLVVVDRGRIVFDFGDVEELSYIASGRKSILAMLYGDWVEKGIIDLDATLGELGMDDIGGLLDIEKQATVRDLLTARSGVYHPASYSGDDLSQAPPRGSQKPGSYMLYSNWDFNAAGYVFELLTGRDIYDEIQSQLAIPMQFQDWDRGAQAKAGNLTVSRYAAYPMWLSTRDMARVGLVMLNEGNWNGEEIIPPEWARRITAVVTPLEEMNPVSRRDSFLGYGHLWWVFDGPAATGPFEGAYWAWGVWGQWIAVFPALDLVVAHKTNNAYERQTPLDAWHRTLELILEAKGAKVDAYPWR